MSKSELIHKKGSLTSDEIRFLFSNEAKTLTLVSNDVDFRDMIKQYHTPAAVERAKNEMDRLHGLMSKKESNSISPRQFFILCLERLNIITTRYYTDIVKLIEVVARNQYHKLLAALSATAACYREFYQTCGVSILSEESPIEIINKSKVIPFKKVYNF